MTVLKLLNRVLSRQERMSLSMLATETQPSACLKSGLRLWKEQRMALRPLAVWRQFMEF